MTTTVHNLEITAPSIPIGGYYFPIEKVGDKYLEDLGIDAHQLKRDWLGKNAPIAEYDIYKNKETGELEIYKKGGKGDGIPTGEFIPK